MAGLLRANGSSLVSLSSTRRPPGLRGLRCLWLPAQIGAPEFTRQSPAMVYAAGAATIEDGPALSNIGAAALAASVPYDAAYHPTAQITLWWYGRTSAGAGAAACLSARGSANEGVGWYDSGGMTAFVYAGGFGIVSTGISQAMAAPRHLAITYDGTTVRAYVDGALSGTATRGGPISYGNSGLRLGDYGDGMGSTAAAHLAAGVWARALSDGEVQSLARDWRGFFGLRSYRKLLYLTPGSATAAMWRSTVSWFS